jgi:hypothetical protein
MHLLMGCRVADRQQREVEHARQRHESMSRGGLSGRSGLVAENGMLHGVRAASSMTRADPPAGRYIGAA